MNILLTGSDGFVGSHLFYHLKEEHNVIGFDLKNGHDILKSEFTKDIDLFVALITSKLTVFVTNPPPRVPADKVVLPSASALFKTELD